MKCDLCQGSSVEVIRVGRAVVCAVCMHAVGAEELVKRVESAEGANRVEELNRPSP